MTDHTKQAIFPDLAATIKARRIAGARRPPDWEQQIRRIGPIRRMMSTHGLGGNVGSSSLLRSTIPPFTDVETGQKRSQE